MKKLMILASLLILGFTGALMANTPTYTPTWTPTATPTFTITQTFTPTNTPTPSLSTYSVLMWNAVIYDVFVNTTQSVNFCYRAVSMIANCYPLQANDLQDAYYKAGLTTINKFNNLTNYSLTLKTIAAIFAPTPKYAAKVNFVATMTPVYPLLQQAGVNMGWAQSVTKATQDKIKIAVQQQFINSVATYVATY